MQGTAPQPSTRVGRLAANFMAQESAGGIVMIAFAALAMIAANSGFAGLYQQFIDARLGLTLGETTLAMPLSVFVKDVLMAIFFLLVGMELKREMLEGFLSKKGQKVLPLIAALGGIVMPALFYMAVNHSVPEHGNGWAIPTATDIAFAVCVLSLLGPRVPASAKIFLLAIAIYDDLAAILIIALFYSSGIAIGPLAIAAFITLLMYLMNRSAIGSIALYILLGAGLCHFNHAAGIHTTVAGMITGLMIPLRVPQDYNDSPLNHLMHRLHPWVSFVILPLFAFVSAGVDLRGISLSVLTDTLPLGIALGLFFGKQLGIFGATFAAVTFSIAAKPEGASWATLYGVSIIAGIGFTMSLFVGFLAFEAESLHNAVKLGVITGSLASAIWGIMVMKWALRRG
jgi:NhaA family Na+:H+ antiporter